MEHIIHTYFGQFGHLPDMNMVLSGRDLAKQLFVDVSELMQATHILHRFDQEDAEVPAEDSNETDGDQSGEECTSVPLALIRRKQQNKSCNNN